MNTYIIKIIKNQKTFMTLCADNNVNYDNCIWWQLSKLVKLLQSSKLAKDELISEIEKNVEYFRCYVEIDHADLVINLDTNTMNKPSVPVYRFNEVKQETCCIDLLKENGQYFAVYEDGSKYQMKNVNYNYDLLIANEVTLDEFISIADFIDSLVAGDETDYILNGEKVMRFNCI